MLPTIHYPLPTYNTMKKIAVILSGCGNRDGSELQESLSLLLAIDRRGWQYQCFAPEGFFEVVPHIDVEDDEEEGTVLDMEQRDIFAAPTKAPENDPDIEFKPRPVEPATGIGKVKTAEEKAREAAEEEERKRAEEEQRRKEEEEEREAKAKKGPSLTSKLMKWLGTFTEPDE